MGRRPTLRSGFALGCALTLGACADDIAAPGTCPEFCPDVEFEIRDTVLLDAIERDSSFVGYVLPHRAGLMQVTSAGADVEARGIIRFLRFPRDIEESDSSAARIPVTGIDSFRLRLPLVERRAGSALQVLVYHLPVSVDSSVTFAGTDSLFAPARVIAQVSVPDSLPRDSVTTDSLFITLPGDAFPDIDADSNQTAIGVIVQGVVETYATFGTVDAGAGASLRRFVRADSSGTEIERSDVRAAAFDTYVRQDQTPLPADALVVGSAPAARALLRVDIPSAILDTGTIVGAHLLLVPVTAIAGAPADTFAVQANGLSADFGAKSPIVLVISSDSLTVPTSRVAVGSTDTVDVDVTAIVRGWQTNENRPHAVFLRASPEGGTLGTLRFGSSRFAGARPVLRLTYVLPFDFARAR